MTDKALANAMLIRDKIARDINTLMQRHEDLKRELSKVDTFIEHWHEFVKFGAAETSKASLALGSSTGTSSVAGVGRSFKNSKKEEVAAAAHELIVASGRPLPRSELYQALIARGLTIEGSEPEMVLSTMLWRSKDTVFRLPKFGYWVHELAYEPAGYSPGKLVFGDEEDAEIARRDFAGTLPSTD